MALHAFRDSRAVAAIRSRRGKPSTQRYQEQAARALEEFCLASRLSLTELASLLGKATDRDVSPKDLEACLRGEGEFPIWLVPAIADVARHRAATFGRHRPLRARLLIATLGLVVLASMCGVGAAASYVGKVDASHRPSSASTAGGQSVVTPSETLPGRTAISTPASPSQPAATPAASPAPPQATDPQATAPPSSSTSTSAPTSMQAPPVTRQPAPAPPPAQPAQAPAPPPARSAAPPAPAPAPAAPAPAPPAPAPAPTAARPAAPSNGGGGGGLLGGVLGLLGL
jgi:hypothetical protein